jgi:hypothetical protein
MKKVFYAGLILSVLMLSACGKVSVEDAAKNYVKKQCAFDKNINFDTSKLKYSVVKKEGDRAIVKVSGTINVDGQLFLVKQGNQWKIGEKKDSQATAQPAMSQLQQKEAGSQTTHAYSPGESAHK